MNKLDVLYSDNHLIVVYKPAGLLVQGDKTKDSTLIDEVKAYLKERFKKPGNVYLGLVHRLDRPTSGVVVFARTSKAAARLSDQFRQKKVKKIYWALLEGKVPVFGKLIHYIERRGVSSIICNEGYGKRAELSFRRLHYKKNISLVEVILETGRHHQIRVQFKSAGHPVIGDLRYGATQMFEKGTIALHAYSIEIVHPTTKEVMTFMSLPPALWNPYLP